MATNQLTLTKLSQLAGLSDGTLHSLIYYTTRLPSLETCVRLAKTTGFHSWNGKLIIFVPDNHGGFKIVDIAHSLGPGVAINKKGNPLTAGVTKAAAMQNATTARAQAAELLLSTNGLPTE